MAFFFKKSDIQTRILYQKGKKLNKTQIISMPETPVRYRNDCCSELRFIFIGNCCCRSLLPDYSEFSIRLIKHSKNGRENTWTCDGCELGFKCSG